MRPRNVAAATSARSTDCLSRRLGMVDCIRRSPTQIGKDYLVQINLVALPTRIEERLSHPHQNAGLAVCAIDLDYLLGMRYGVNQMSWTDEPLVIADDRVHIACQLRVTPREHDQVVACST